MFELTYRLEEELRNQRHMLDALVYKYETQRIKTAKYYSFHMRRWDLGDRLQKQIQENHDAIIGEFDGFAYASWRANATFRTLEDMVKDGIITKEEYCFCKI